MPAGTANLLIEKGTDFIREFTLKDKTNNTVINLTGSTITFDIAAKQGNTSILSIPILVPTPLLGKFTAKLDQSLVDLITITSGWFVINITWSNGDTERLVEGRVVISKGVL